MAIGDLLKVQPSMDDIERILAPLHQKGCKITRGAGITLPAPTLKTALLLVRERRASSRILQPIAAARIQHAWAHQIEARRAHAVAAASAASALQVAWRRHMVLVTLAAVRLQAAWRRYSAAAAFEAQLRAQLRISSVARGLAQRRTYRLQLAQLMGPLARIQAAVRGWLRRRHFKTVRSAALTIESTWRRVRVQVVRRRLERAANALRQGGRLSKYRKGGKRERHARFAWVSEDLQHFYWSPVVDRFDEAAPKLRTIPMASITAVTEGVKTPLLKKMDKRAAEPPRLLSFAKKPLELDETCAFSIICRERVVDFYADNQASRDAWLRDLKTALTYAHTYDHKAALAAVQRLSVERAPTKGSESDTDEDL